jgi:PAS domain S-box-containing protein
MELELSRLIDALPDLVWTAHPEGRPERVNRGWCEYTGLQPDEAASAGWESVVHPEDRARLLERWRTCLASGRPDEMQARLRRSDGAYRWFLFRATPMHGESGSIVRWLGSHTDIEGHSRAQEALAASERHLRSIVDAIPTTAWTTRPDGYCDFLNQRWLDYAGMTPEQALGWGWAAVIHPADRDRLVEYWQSCLASGTRVDVEARMRRYDGAYRWFLFRANPLRDEAGNISKWYGTNVDIEDRKRVEEALLASELSWRQIVDDIPGFVATTGAAGEVEFLNRQILEYFGRTTGELKDWSLIGAIHPDDLPRIVEARAKSIETGQIYDVEHRCRRADGIYRWFQVRGLPVRNAEGTTTAWYLLLTDIEERKRAEAEAEQAYLRLAEAQRISKTGSFVTDLLMDHHDWSAEALRIFEFDPAEKITLQKLRNVVHPEDLPAFEAEAERAATGAEVDFVYRIRTATGTVKYLRALARVIQRVDGRPLYIGAMQDVTDSKLAEQALSRARTELAHASRIMTLGALTASIAHEVNQPLSGVVTNASTCLRMLAADPPNLDGARATTQRTLRDGNRASDVVQRLRTLFSQKEPKYEPVDLNDATGEVIALSMSELQRAQVTLRTELDERLPPIRGDRVQLQQVLLNLILNAAEAMREVDDRPRDLLITTTREDPNRVRLSVRDSGVGIDPQSLEKVFDAFYTTKTTGMGIGLSISRSIVQSHQGRLWASANEGPGATFSFCVPYEPDPAPALPGRGDEFGETWRTQSSTTNRQGGRTKPSRPIQSLRSSPKNAPRSRCTISRVSSAGGRQCPRRLARAR